MYSNFSHLVVNGCSFTACVGLDNPAEQGWPKLLADKLGIPLINLALQGTGNDRILRSTVEHIYKNPLPNPLYLIAFSHSSRREEYYHGTYQQLHLNQRVNDHDIRFFVQHYNSLIYSQKKIQLWLSLVNTFKANNISYLTTDFIPDSTEDKVELSKSYSELVNAVNNDPNRLIDFEFLTRGLPKLPCGHEDLPTMKIIAEYAYKEIEKRWH